MAVKLTQKSLNEIRTKLIQAQGGRCALCEKPFMQIYGTPCVDHDHKTGMVRGVICSNCNGMEGKILNRAIRACRKRMSPVEWVAGLVDYWKFHEANPSGYIYPTHKTADEKRVARNAKARKTRKKRKITK